MTGSTSFLTLALAKLRETTTHYWSMMAKVSILRNNFQLTSGVSLKKETVGFTQRPPTCVQRQLSTFFSFKTSSLPILTFEVEHKSFPDFSVKSHSQYVDFPRKANHLLT